MKIKMAKTITNYKWSGPTKLTPTVRTKKKCCLVHNKLCGKGADGYYCCCIKCPKRTKKIIAYDNWCKDKMEGGLMKTKKTKCKHKWLEIYRDLDYPAYIILVFYCTKCLKLRKIDTYA